MCSRLILTKTVAVLTGSEIEPRGSHGVRVGVEMALLGSRVTVAVAAVRDTYLIRCTP